MRKNKKNLTASGILRENIQFLSPVATARGVLESNLDLFRLPIDVEALCERQNIAVRYVDFYAIEREVKLEISGAVQKSGDKYTIFVNEESSDERARFAVAHELGHYFMHMRDDHRSIVASFRRDNSPREIAANKFAAELLAPKNLLQEEYRKMVIPVAQTLARKCGVSNRAMRMRLNSLGLLYV